VKTEFKINIIEARLIILKKLHYARLYDRCCSGDLGANVDHLHAKSFQLVNFIYIVIEDVQLV
jgi:hypothetical protein